MASVVRTDLRLDETQEFFTPTALVQDLLNQLDQSVFADPTKTFLDPTCGDGQFLGEVLIRKMNAGLTFEQALTTIYGVDLMPDNVEACKRHLLCGFDSFKHIVDNNILCADALSYNYRFGHPEVFGNGLFELG